MFKKTALFLKMAFLTIASIIIFITNITTIIFTTIITITLIPGKATQAPAQSPIYEIIGETVVMAFVYRGSALIKTVLFGHCPFGGKDQVVVLFDS